MTGRSERTRKPARPGRIRRFGAWLRDHYMTIDPRTLGLLRLVMGLLLVLDFVRHWYWARLYYSNDGVVTNHLHLYKPSSSHNFSLFHAFSSPAEVHVAFALSVTCAFLLFIGWRTRLMHLLTFLAVTSMDNRLVLVENGGYIVVNLLVGWTMFLPMGERFSVDAWWRSFAARAERTADELNKRRRALFSVAPKVSLVVLLMQLNFATIYFFNVVNKSGAIWRRGETVHYVLHIDRMVTGLAVFFREHLPYWLTRPTAWLVLCVEALLVFLILAPYGRRVTRPLAIALVWGLHLSFGTMMRLGPFAWFMMTFALVLVTPLQWDAFERWFRKRAPRVTVTFDDTRPLALGVCRAIARLDGYRLVTFAAERGAPLSAAKTTDASTRRTGAGAIDLVAHALPLGRWALWGARLGCFGAFPAIVRWLEQSPERVERFFGLGLPRPHPPLTVAPLRRRVGSLGSGLREAFLAYLGLIAVSQALNENKSVPDVLKHEQPGFVRATLVYPRLFQGWGMFAPNPIQDDGVLVIDGWTIDGRRIDPLTGRVPDLDLTDSRGEALGQISQDYGNRIRSDKNKRYRSGLKDFLIRWHEVSGRPEDELVAFDAYWVMDHCPRPGSDQPYDGEAIAILSWRKPGYRPPPGMPALPRKPEIKSAGK